MDAQTEPERDFVLSSVQPIFIVFDCTSNASLQSIPKLQVPIDSTQIAQKAKQKTGTI